MLKIFYSQIDRLPLGARQKFLLFFLLTGILLSLCGLFAWLIIRRWALNSWDWLICFLGYPFIIAWFAVYLHTLNSDFHDGQFPA